MRPDSNEFCPQCRGELRSPKKYIIKAQVPNGSSRFCVISLTCHRSDRSLCPLRPCGSFPSTAGLYLRIHFTHQIQESQTIRSSPLYKPRRKLHILIIQKTLNCLLLPPSASVQTSDVWRAQSNVDLTTQACRRPC